MREFDGRVAVVTGGASGIGFSLASAFAAEGAKIVLGDIEAPALDEAVGKLEASGAEVIGVVTDVSDAAQVQALADAAVERFGAIHIACNNAGVGAGGLSWEAPLSTWEWVLGVNLWGVIHGLRAFVPILMQQSQAYVVNTASVAGVVAGPFMAPYNASKHAVVALSETLHHEMAMMAPQVKVSVLCPGWVRTRIADSARNRPDGSVEGCSRRIRAVRPASHLDRQGHVVRRGRDQGAGRDSRRTVLDLPARRARQLLDRIREPTGAFARGSHEPRHALAPDGIETVSLCS